jgi:hypothetical protein
MRDLAAVPIRLIQHIEARPGLYIAPHASRPPSLHEYSRVLKGTQGPILCMCVRINARTCQHASTRVWARMCMRVQRLSASYARAGSHQPPTRPGLAACEGRGQRKCAGGTPVWEGRGQRKCAGGTPVCEGRGQRKCAGGTLALATRALPRVRALLGASVLYCGPTTSPPPFPRENNGLFLVGASVAAARHGTARHALVLF